MQPQSGANSLYNTYFLMAKVTDMATASEGRAGIGDENAREIDIAAFDLMHLPDEYVPQAYR